MNHTTASGPGATPGSGGAGASAAPAGPAVLPRLVAVDAATFASEFWGRRALLSRADELPRSFADLLSADTVDELVSERGLRTPFLRVAKNGTTLADRTFTAPGGVGAGIADQVSDDKLVSLFADGSTLVLQALHRVWPPIIELCQQLAAELGHPVQANAYVTPPQNQGFSDHYDVHDVFVLQIEGEKRWQIHAPVLESPLRDQPWSDRRAAVAARAAEEPLLEVVLRPGDCLYLPRGFLHAATALGGVSTHLTLGVHAWTGYALAEQLVQQALRLVADDPAVRASLPLGVDLGEPAALRPEVDHVRQQARGRAGPGGSRPGDLGPADGRPREPARGPGRAAPSAQDGRDPAAGHHAGAAAPSRRLAGGPRRPAGAAEPGGRLRRVRGRGTGRQGPARPRVRDSRRPGRGPRPPARARRAGPGRVSTASDHDGGPGTAPAPRCAVAAAERADPMRGTAPPTRRWLLLEHPGPWRIDALAGAGLDPSVLARLSSAAASTGTRILLIRRPGRTTRPDRRQWLLSGPGVGTVGGSWAADDDLLAAADALDATAPPTAASTDPLLLVCAHGVHDACCAIRGRPVAAALDQRWPGQVWECSHVGGDRFAPNVVVLPDGFYYGGLDGAGAVDTVAAHLAGQVRTAQLRGMARFPPPQQAAVIAALERYGPLGADAVAVTASRHEGRYGAPGSRTLLELRVAGVTGAVHAEVVAVRQAPARLTCRAERATPATQYRVERLG